MNRLRNSSQALPCRRTTRRPRKGWGESDRLRLPTRWEPSMDGWLGVVLMIVLGVGFTAVMIGLSVLLGPKNPTPEKLAPYECGMPAVGDARERQSVKFYLVAMIFLLFDIEIAFLY